MTSDPDATDPDAEPDEAAPVEGVVCDFCGDVVDSVHRVALDGDYERLRTRHEVQYSCAACFEKKERERKDGTG
jgi:hypothetical protein